MTTERRLDLLTSELTARERAVLVLRASLAGEKADDRITRYCPPQDRAEMERIVAAIERASGEAHGVLIILLEWTANVEQDVNWLGVLRLYQARVEALERVARRPVPDLPCPPDVGRKVPIGWGRLMKEDEEGPAQDWKTFHDSLVRDIERSLCLRWRDALSLEATLADVGTAMGEPLVHVEVRRLLDAFRDTILRLHAELAAMGLAVELPADSGGQLEWVRETIDWDALRPVGTQKHAREWMHESQRQELEAYEREQAEQLRGGS